MATLTSLMNLATNALLADQSALNATSNNVANQNTVGYTREVVHWQTADSLTIGKSSVGQGATATTSSVRDRVLEQRVDQQTQVAAQSDTLASTLDQVQSIFGISASSSSAASTALGSAIDSFFNSLSTLESNPSDTSTRQSVLSAAGNLADAFHAVSSQIAGVTNSLNHQASDLAGQINTLTTTIASLNQKIATSSPNADAGTLEDQRQSAIAQLSQLIGVDQVTTEQNGLTLTTTDGTVLVSGAQSFGLQTTTVGGATHILSSDGVDITAGVSGGALGGVLQARDKVLPGIVSSLDNLAYSIGTAVNTQNAAGVDGSGNPGAAIFTLPASAAGAASTIALAMTDPASIAAAATGEGSTGNSNAVALAEIATQAVAGGQTPDAAYASFLSQLGNTAASASQDDATQQAALTQLTTQRDSLSGVSLDEEAANLTQYQRSYEAASKVFSIVDSLMAVALNLGVESAVS